jgi:D-glycero-D-manno-heptose 1,7-bisphosphate phosphatase
VPDTNQESSTPAPAPEKKSSRKYMPRELPESAPDRIDFGSRLVLYKKMQTEDMVLYMTHIKGKPTFLFVMDKLDPATAIAWKGAFRNREGVILADRDGVVKDSRFLNDTDKASAADVMVPSALTAAKRANQAKIGIGIVTNQGGYQAGQMSFEDTIAINVRVIQQIANAGGHVDAVFICPFAKGLDSEKPGVYDARKPSPGMFMFAEQLAAANKVPVLASTGDQRTDGAAAQAAGQKFYAITGPSGRWIQELEAANKRGEELPQLNQDPTVYQEVTEFADVVEAILSQASKQ